MTNKKISYNIVFILIITLFVAVMIFAISQKKALHIDEYYSYACANNMNPKDGGKRLDIDRGYMYEPADAPYLDMLSVYPENRLSYHQIWDNLSVNCHVPFYYIILHSICAIFPNSFSIWYAGFVNIVFAVFTLFIFSKIMYELTADRKISMMSVFYFALCYGIIDSIVFLRMYIVAMCMDAIISLIFISHTKEKMRLKDYIILFVCSVLTALTHYYCIFYLVFASFGYGIILFVQKKWNEIAKFSVTMILSAIAAIAIYPPMLMIVNSEARGKESVGNLSSRSISEYIEYLKYYLFKTINGELFGYVLLFLVCISLLVSIVLIRKNIRILSNDLEKDDRDKLYKIICLLIPVVLYYLMISRVAVMQTNRYLNPIYPILLALGLYLVYHLSKQIEALCNSKRNDKICIISFGICILIMLVSSYGLNGKLSNLKSSRNSLYDKVQEHKSSDVVALYSHNSRIAVEYLYIKGLKSISFAKRTKVEELKNISFDSEDGIVLMLETTDGEDNPAIFTDIYPQWSNVERLGNNGRVVYYHLGRTDNENE